MEVTVQEGSWVEVPTSAVTGIDRRAFGELVGRGGELASYALGWATNADPHVGRLTVGIGAGNPAGGTFHAVVFAHEGSYAFSLVDEPFEQVPEGGPDLSADQARGHEDLPFVWWVADQVMDRDRRAWWMWHWVLETNAIQTTEVFNLHEPILLISNDADDDLWQLIGSTDAGPDGKTGHLYHAVDEDPTLIDVLGLKPGQSAVRDRVGGPWTRRLEEPGA